MSLTIAVFLFIAGAALIIFGADWMVDGASGIARHFGLSEFLIGVTIVGIGTSMPELSTSTFAAISGNADITIGNIVGSNIFNSLLILGVTALIMPVNYTKNNMRRDIPTGIAVSLLLMFFSMDSALFGKGSDTIGRIEGIILLIAFCAYIFFNFKLEKGETSDSTSQKSGKESVHLWKHIALVTIGLAMLIGGGKLFVDSGIAIAASMGVPDTIVATFLMAGGTSLPELVTCIVAAAKKRGQMALGNIIGSNVSNILLIIGLGATITPLNVDAINLFSIKCVVLAAILILVAAVTFKRKVLDRGDAILFLAAYAAYIWYILKIQ